MQLTRFGFHGLLFYVVMFGAFFASPYSNLFFLLLSFLTLLGAGGIVGALRNLHGVRAALGELPPIASGTEARLPLALAAPGRVRLQIDACVVLQNGETVAGRLHALERTGTVSLMVPPMERGLHRVESASLESTHPFGLLRVRRSFEAPLELVVYPSPRAFFEGRSAPTDRDELLAWADPSAGSLQPESLRDFREGDELRQVHWRSSARRGRLVVQEWEGGAGSGIEVLLDRRCSAAELEEALSAVSALVLAAREAKETLRLHSQGCAATFGEGHRPWKEVLVFLAAAERLPKDGPAPPPTPPRVLRLPHTLPPGTEVEVLGSRVG